MSAKARLFKVGGSQAVRLPKAFRFEGEAVSIRREGKAVILEPLEAAGQWQDWVEDLRRLAREADEPFPDRLPQPEPKPRPKW